MTDIIIGPGDSPTAMVVNSDGSINVNTGGVSGVTIAQPTAVSSGLTGVVNFLGNPTTGTLLTYDAPTQVLTSTRLSKGRQVTAMPNSTAETTIVTAIAATFTDLYGVVITNSSATTTYVTIKDGTGGTTATVLAAVASDTRGYMLGGGDGLTAAAVNTNWTATLSAGVATVTITALYNKNT